MQEIELISKRNLREKHFLKKNGLIEAKIYDQNVHYLKNGTFEEIDNTLLEENEEYVNKANSYKVHFTKNLKKYLMKIERENYYIEVSLSTQNKFKLKKEVNKEKSISNIVYQNIFKGVNIRYSLLPNHVKEYITLNNKEFDTNNLVFVLKTNLKLVENEDRSINVVEGTNIIFTLNSPYMTDKNGIVNDNVFYKFDYKDNQYILKLVVDQEWLKSETTKYPVNIDPTITNYGESNNVYDTYIFPNDSSVDRNNREYLKVGVENTNGFNTINRALIKFELPTIGTGSQIIEANLNLRGYPDFTHSYTTDFVNVYRITTDWNETDANWNSMNNKYDSRVEGTFESNRIYYIDSDGNISLSTCGCDITNIVKKWYSDYPNYGIMLKLNNEVYKTDVIPMFFSKNNSISGGNPKPLLSIVYRNQNGLEDYMYYQEQIFTIGKTYHNIYNGNLTSVFNIGSTISGKMPINLKIIYNTNDVVLNNNYGYGIGYRLNLLQTIQEEIIENITYLKYIDSDGTIHYFSNQRVKYDETSGYFITAYENTFFDEDGLDLTIERDNTDYILIDKNNNQMKFSIDNKIGYLSSIIDVSGNKNTIYYDSNHKIIKIVDANNSEISINYSTNLISVISPDQTISLNYSNNNLISIVSILGTTSFINTNNLITSIIDITGKKISYEYYSQSPYRIKKSKNMELIIHWEKII